MNLLLLGMPSSGKTTFLGALSHVLTSGRSVTSLRLLGLSEQEAHVAALEELWLACEEVPRTNVRSTQEGAFRVQVGDDGPEALISVPDLSGEAFRMPAARDRCPSGLFELLLAADGLVLFTNADKPSDDRLIFDAASQYDALEAAFEAELDADESISDDKEDEGPEASGGSELTEPTPPSTGEAPDSEPTRPFNPDDMPEEVLLVELLQQINRLPLAARKRGLALVVSAWDAVPNETAPEDWLARWRPMLNQFLRHNGNLWDVRVWGISALGGSLRTDGDRLRAMAEPIERVRVVGNDASPHDLTAPIQWLMTRPTIAP